MSVCLPACLTLDSLDIGPLSIILFWLRFCVKLRELLLIVTCFGYQLKNWLILKLNRRSALHNRRLIVNSMDIRKALLWSQARGTDLFTSAAALYISQQWIRRGPSNVQKTFKLDFKTYLLRIAMFGCFYEDAPNEHGCSGVGTFPYVGCIFYAQ